MEEELIALLNALATDLRGMDNALGAALCEQAGTKISELVEHTQTLHRLWLQATKDNKEA